jgi:pimeloyl-ACP methyl ester carboxylesterase
MYNTLVSWIDSCPSIKPLLLIGHSMGGYFCLRYAWQHPEHVSGLGLINPLYTPGQISPVLRLLNCSPRLSGRIIGLAPSWLVMSVLRLDPTRNKRLPKPHLERFIHDYKQLSPHVFTLPHTLLDLKSSLQDIPCPALVVWGKRDLILNPASFPLLVQQLPQAVSLMLPTVGHEPHLEYPALVNPHMVEFSRQFIGRKNPILR